MKNFLPILSAGLITLFTVLSYPACMNRSSGSQEDKAGQGKFTVDQLQADFRQFRQFLEESHPKLYQFTSRRTFDSKGDNGPPCGVPPRAGSTNPPAMMPA